MRRLLTLAILCDGGGPIGIYCMGPQDGAGEIWQQELCLDDSHDAGNAWAKIKDKPDDEIDSLLTRLTADLVTSPDPENPVDADLVARFGLT